MKIKNSAAYKYFEILTNLPDGEELSLMRMRHAYSTTRTVINLFYCLSFFWWLSFVGASVIGFTQQPKGGQIAQQPEVGQVVLLMAVFFSMTYVIILYLQFLMTSLSRMSVVLSLGLTFLMFWCFTLSLGKILAGIASGAGGNFWGSFFSAYTLFLASCLFQHSARVWILKPEERKSISPFDQSQSHWKKIFSPLAAQYGHRVNPLRKAWIAFLNNLAGTSHGFSMLVQIFIYGAGLFSALFLGRGLVMNDLDVGPSERKILQWIPAFYSILFLVAWGFVLISIVLRRIAKGFLRVSYEALLETDERSPILFLRTFDDDQVTLPNRNWFVRLWYAEDRKRRLDHEIVEQFSRLGPVVAIGKPDTDLPFGAARLYVSDSEWRDAVKEIASKSLGIVLVADDSPGIEWEVRTMLEDQFSSKTLFLANPQREEEWGLEQHSVLGSVLSETRDVDQRFGVVGACKFANNWKLFTSPNLIGDDYLVCCRAFLKHLHSQTEARL